MRHWLERVAVGQMISEEGHLPPEWSVEVFFAESRVTRVAVLGRSVSRESGGARAPSGQGRVNPVLVVSRHPSSSEVASFEGEKRRESGAADGNERLQ
jgi:hypothetical protein